MVRCDGLRSQFAWSLWFINPALWNSKNWSDVIWNVHHRKLMGFLGQKWECRQCDRGVVGKGIGVTNGWGVGSLVSKGKACLAIQSPSQPHHVGSEGTSLCGAALPGIRIHKALLIQVVPQNSAALEAVKILVYLVQISIWLVHLSPIPQGHHSVWVSLAGLGWAGLILVEDLPVGVECWCWMLPRWTGLQGLRPSGRRETELLPKRRAGKVG